MALAERAELVARLSLQDDFSRRASAVSKNFAGSMAKIQSAAIQGAKNTATNLGRIGVVAGGFIALNVKQGISSLAELEDAVTSVDGAIKTVGKGWTTTGQQIATIANEIETNVQRAFDDKEITQATTTLIRYGGVAEKNLRPAMEVMTDLAAKTGSLDSASSLLAKALAAPEKAGGKLARMGIILTKAQEKQIKALVNGGKAAEAQAVLLDILRAKTDGAAEAMAGPYRDAINILRDVTEDAQRALGEAFLPVISKVADKLSTALADPKTITDLRNFGKTLAGAFDKALEVGGKIPWGTIGDSLKMAGTGAKAVFDAFTSLPPWVQTAVLTGWGLNKLSGGALGSIVGELGKGLIKGVLGMNAGVVNIKAGVVNGGGGGPVPGGGGNPVANAAGGAVAAAVVVQGAIDIGAIINGFDRVLKANSVNQITDAINTVKNDVVLLPPGIKGLMDLWLNQVPPKITEPFDDAAFRLGEKVNLASQVETNALHQVRDKAEANRIATVTGLNGVKSTTTALSAAEQAKLTAIRDRAEATRIAAMGTTTAIKNKKMVANTRVSVRVSTSVTTSSIARATKTTRTFSSGVVSGHNEFG